jgi:hypothetical protein
MFAIFYNLRFLCVRLNSVEETDYNKLEKLNMRVRWLFYCKDPPFASSKRVEPQRISEQFVWAKVQTKNLPNRRSEG